MEKIDTAEKYLRENKTEDVVLFLDGWDSLVIGDLQNVLKTFREKKCQALFSTEWHDYPVGIALSRPLEKIEAGGSTHPFINVGSWIARKDWAMAAWASARAFCLLYKGVTCGQSMCDQFGLRMVYLERHPEAKTDPQSEAFQTMYRSETDLEIVET
jgi:hypothetical protein